MLFKEAINISILKQLRLNKGVSQEEVAKTLGISMSAISMYENGERTPRDEIKVKLAKYYKRGVGEIFLTKYNTERVLYKEVFYETKRRC